ncbi:hypothetical protein [Pedobacter yonginense]|nr:hypothetical protein [Pedobacter yonginense]
MDKEIIKHIVTQLHGHEESYSEGAWERFSLPERKKRRVIAYWPLWSAAALILITAAIFFGRDNNALRTDLVVKHPSSKKQQVDLQKNTNLQQQKKSNQNTDNQIVEPILLSEQIVKKPKGAEDQMAYAVSNNGTDIFAKQVVAPPNSNEVTTSNSHVNLLENHSAGNTLIASNTERAFNIIVEKRKTLPKTTFEELLAKDSQVSALSPANKNTKDSKWSPGVYVAPAMGNDNKVNMNYGFSLAYKVAGKLSISSGIAYTALSSTSNPSSSSSAVMDSQASTSSLSRDSKNLESVDAQLRGINIPLELKYSFSDKFYTGIGVSALAILNNRQENNYIINQAQNTTVLNTMGYAEQKMLLVTQRVSEPQAESVIAPEKYLGFYNFSLGYKQKISPKKNIAIEPFLRLPMRTFSKENLNLTNGGLRIKVDF